MPKSWRKSERVGRDSLLASRLGQVICTLWTEAERMSSQVKSEKRLYVGNLATSVDERVALSSLRMTLPGN